MAHYDGFSDKLLTLSLFQALSQWGRSKKRFLDERDLVKKIGEGAETTNFFLPGQIPLVRRPLFRSCPLTESLQQAINTLRYAFYFAMETGVTMTSNKGPLSVNQYILSQLVDDSTRRFFLKVLSIRSGFFALAQSEV